jgi:pyruvate,water dikinase
LTDNAAADVFSKLDDSAESTSFKKKIADFSLVYGKRGERGTLVSKSINPVTLLETIQNNLKQPDDFQQKQQETWAAQRDQRLQEVRAQLQNQPQEVVEKFESHLKMTENANQIRELHNEWIDVPAMNYFRLIVQEFARRLTEGGVIENKDDVYHLSSDEMRSAAAMLPEVLDVRQRIKERQLEEERFENVAPPAFMGAFPASMEYTLDPLTVSYINVEAPNPVEIPGGMGAVPASPGKVKGRAKVVRNLYEIDKLEPGDIMVVGSLGPTWTPLFEKIGGVLADIGGILSHAAILSREYGIPCVVGFRTATSLIKDGQLIEVDGDNGTVIFLDDDGSPSA